LKKFISILFFFSTWQFFAQDIAVPIDVQFPIFFKIFSYDKNLTQKVKDHFDLLIVYQRKFRTSLNIKNSAQSVLEGKSFKYFNSSPVIIKSISIESASELDEYLAKNHIDCIYIAPLRAIHISEITSITRKRKILSTTGVVEYVEQGVSVGLAIKSEKPQILINLPASKAEGADFSSQLLKLAKIIE